MSEGLNPDGMTRGTNAGDPRPSNLNSRERPDVAKVERSGRTLRVPAELASEVLGVIKKVNSEKIDSKKINHAVMNYVSSELDDVLITLGLAFSEQDIEAIIDDIEELTTSIPSVEPCPA